jgi:outer membrane protein TolC
LRCDTGRAFQDVADTLHALRHDAESLKATAAAAAAAKITLDLTRLQMGQTPSSDTSQLALLNAEQTYQQAMINLVQAQANRYADTAALFQALGGGWWHRAEIVKNN